MANKVWKDSVAELEKQISAWQRERDRHVFASVSIDGDSMLFSDDLIQQKREGGKGTVKIIKEAVAEQLLSSNQSAAAQIKVVVRVHADVRDLARTYKNTGILSDPASFDEFIRGFIMGDHMCDYVDASDKKECADKKVEANARQALADVHCQRVFFSGARDNGYARLLESLDGVDQKRITFLEGSPFADELAATRGTFGTAAISKVVRAEKLVESQAQGVFQTHSPNQPRHPTTHRLRSHSLRHLSSRPLGCPRCRRLQEFCTTNWANAWTRR